MSILELSKQARKSERVFHSNPWRFAKSVCQAGKSEKKPTFSRDECLTYFTSLYSSLSDRYHGLPEWISEDVMPPPEVTSDFDLSPITPHTVKITLQKCSASSAPGPDSISYCHLRHLPSCHHFLATLFTKILLQGKPGPKSW